MKLESLPLRQLPCFAPRKAVRLLGGAGGPVGNAVVACILTRSCVHRPTSSTHQPLTINIPVRVLMPSPVPPLYAGKPSRGQRTALRDWTVPPWLQRVLSRPDAGITHCFIPSRIYILASMCAILTCLAIGLSSM